MLLVIQPGYAPLLRLVASWQLTNEVDGQSLPVLPSALTLEPPALVDCHCLMHGDRKIPS